MLRSLVGSEMCIRDSTVGGRKKQDACDIAGGLESNPGAGMARALIKQLFSCHLAVVVAIPRRVVLVSMLFVAIPRRVTLVVLSFAAPRWSSQALRHPSTVPTTATCRAGAVQHHRVVFGFPQARLALPPAGVLTPRESRDDDGGVGCEGHGEHSRRDHRHPGHSHTVPPSKGRRHIR